MLRGGRTELTAPNPFTLVKAPDALNGRLVIAVLPGLAKFAVEFTPSNWVWLKALKASRRISNLTFSLTRNSFESARSQLLIGPTRRKFRPDSNPWLPTIEAANAEVSNIRYGSLLLPLSAFFSKTIQPPATCCVPVRP